MMNVLLPTPKKNNIKPKYEINRLSVSSSNCVLPTLKVNEKDLSLLEKIERNLKNQSEKKINFPSDKYSKLPNIKGFYLGKIFSEENGALSKPNNRIISEMICKYSNRENANKFKNIFSSNLYKKEYFGLNKKSNSIKNIFGSGMDPSSEETKDNKENGKEIKENGKEMPYPVKMRNKRYLFKSNSLLCCINRNKVLGESQEKTKQIEEKKTNLFLSYSSCHSFAGVNGTGHTKTNQDTYININNMNNVKGICLYGVLDGHGENGHIISNYAKDKVIYYITKLLADNNILLDDYKMDKDKEEVIKQNISIFISMLTASNYSQIKEIFDIITLEIKREHRKEAEFSGTTCCLILKLYQHLITINIGDSRSILIKKSIEDRYNVTEEESKVDPIGKIKNNISIQLTTDHNPKIISEKKRIIKNGGAVRPQANYQGKTLSNPHRVYVKGKNYPGLAMSRSLGDLVGEEVGVIHVPDVTIQELNEGDWSIVIGSDGVWDIIDYNEIEDILEYFYKNGDAYTGAKILVDKCKEKWDESEFARDDITAVVVFFGNDNGKHQKNKLL